jgi:hypothetical protein
MAPIRDHLDVDRIRVYSPVQCRADRGSNFCLAGVKQGSIGATLI